MTVITSYKSQTDVNARNYVFSGDQTKLKEVATKVSEQFLNQEFYTMCCCDYASSIEGIVEKNPNFPSMDRLTLLRSINLLVFKNHPNLINLIIKKRSTFDGIYVMKERIGWLEFYSEDNSEKYSERLASAQREIKEVAATLDERFLNQEFYNMCKYNFASAIEGIVKENPYFSSMDREEIIRSMGYLALYKHKDLITIITNKICGDSGVRNPVEAMIPANKAMTKVVDSLRIYNAKDPGKYSEMLSWAEDRQDFFYKAQLLSLDMRLPPSSSREFMSGDTCSIL